MQRTETLKTLSPQAFAELGMESVIYIKPVVENGVTAFAVHNATGQPIGLMESPAHAKAAALEHELEVVSLH